MCSGKVWLCVFVCDVLIHYTACFFRFFTPSTNTHTHTDSQVILLTQYAAGVDWVTKKNNKKNLSKKAQDHPETSMFVIKIEIYFSFFYRISPNFECLKIMLIYKNKTNNNKKNNSNSRALLFDRNTNRNIDTHSFDGTQSLSVCLYSISWYPGPECLCGMTDLEQDTPNP